MDSDSEWSDNVEGGREANIEDNEHGNHHLVTTSPSVKVVSDPELVGSSESGKNWRGIFIAVVVIAVVCGLIVIAVVLVTPGRVDGDLRKPFTFDDMFNDEFNVQTFEAKWMADTNKYIYRDAEGDLIMFDADTNTSRLIIDKTTMRNWNQELYHFVSSDLEYVLIATEIEPIYRHTFKARYFVYKRHVSDGVNNIIPFPQSARDEWTNKKLQYANWLPKGHGLVFVYDNNLYYQPDLVTTPTQITESGIVNRIFNGIPDWLYEEEILHTNVAHWFSADGKYISYAQFNDSLVPVFKFSIYGEANNLYGSISELAYPKAGDTSDHVNPTVKIFVVETGKLKSVHRLLAVPPQFANTDHYVTLIRWQDDTHILVAWSNRAQNKTILNLCYVVTGNCRQILVEDQHGGKGWVFIEDVKFIDGGRHFLTILPQNEGESGFWKHIAMITASVGRSYNNNYYLTR